MCRWINFDISRAFWTDCMFSIDMTPSGHGCSPHTWELKRPGIICIATQCLSTCSDTPNSLWAVIHITHLRIPEIYRSLVMECILMWLRDLGFHRNTLRSNLRVLPYVSIYLNRSHQYIVTFHCPWSGYMWPVQLFHGFWRQCSKAIKFCVGRFPKLLRWSKKHESWF